VLPVREYSRNGIKAAVGLPPEELLEEELDTLLLDDELNELDELDEEDELEEELTTLLEEELLDVALEDELLNEELLEAALEEETLEDELLELKLEVDTLLDDVFELPPPPPPPPPPHAASDKVAARQIISGTQLGVLAVTVCRVFMVRSALIYVAVGSIRCELLGCR